VQCLIHSQSPFCRIPSSNDFSWVRVIRQQHYLTVPANRSLRGTYLCDLPNSLTFSIYPRQREKAYEYNVLPDRKWLVRPIMNSQEPAQNYTRRSLLSREDFGATLYDVSIPFIRCIFSPTRSLIGRDLASQKEVIILSPITQLCASSAQ
jgi:hypothetical protein